MPLHWNKSGMVDRYGSKYELLLLLPVSATIVFAGGIAAEARYVFPSPKTKGFMSFLQLFFLMTFFILQITGLFRAQHIYLRQESFLTVPAALMLVYVSNVSRNAEYLSDFGVKTKWTIKSRSVWNRTNRLASNLFFAAAILMLIPVFLPDLFFGMLIALVVVIFTILVVYSKITAKNEAGSEAKNKGNDQTKNGNNNDLPNDKSHDI